MLATKDYEKQIDSIKEYTGKLKGYYKNLNKSYKMLKRAKKLS